MDPQPLYVDRYVLDGTMHHAVQLGRDSWILFKICKNHALPHTREVRLLVEFQFSHFHNVGATFPENDLNVSDTDGTFHLVYQGDYAVDCVTARIFSRSTWSKKQAPSFSLACISFIWNRNQAFMITLYTIFTVVNNDCG